MTALLVIRTDGHLECDCPREKAMAIQNWGLLRLVVEDAYRLLVPSDEDSCHAPRMHDDLGI